MTQIARLSDMDCSSLSQWRTFRRLEGTKSQEKGQAQKKEPQGHYCPRGSGWKEAATYSPALHCSTIGASGLNFSVRNGKRWDPTAITTWCLVFSSQICSWLVDKLFVFLSYLSLLFYQATRLLVYSFTSKLFLLTGWQVICLICRFYFIKQLVYSSTAYLLTINSFTRPLSTC